MRLADIAVEGLQVKLELAEVLRLEFTDLELNGYQAVQTTMEEEQVEVEVLAADLDGYFTADEAEIATQLGQEVPQVAQEALVQVGLEIALYRSTFLRRAH